MTKTIRNYLARLNPRVRLWTDSEVKAYCVTHINATAERYSAILSIASAKALTKTQREKLRSEWEWAGSQAAAKYEADNA